MKPRSFERGKVFLPYVFGVHPKASMKPRSFERGKIHTQRQVFNEAKGLQ